MQDGDKRTPLHHAAISGNEDVVELLVVNKAAINSQDYQGFTPLHWAASKGHLGVVRMLIKYGADIHIRTNRGRTPLFLVAMNNGNTSIAKLLIDAGADVNSAENSGATPLSYAPFRGFNEIIDLLLDHGARVEVDTDLWFEVFHRACAIGHNRLAQLMISEGLDVSKKNEDGRLPLHSAAEGGASKLIDFLIERGNAIDSKDYCGNTPLHLAAQSGHRDVVQRLVHLGADINVKNMMGETPYNLATKKKKHEIIVLLSEKGANPSPSEFPMIKGEYLGQPEPGLKPDIFAPGLVSAYAPIHGCPTFSTDGKEIYWSVVDFEKRGSTIYCTLKNNGKWSKPALPSFSSLYSDDVPYCSPEGDKLFFLSNRPVEPNDEPSKENIWVMHRLGDSWDSPKPIGSAINGMDLHWQFSVTEHGAIYFGSSSGAGLGLNDIYRSELVDGTYQRPQNLGRAINSEYSDFAPFIAPDESFLIFTSMGRPAGSGLYISFRNKDGSWSEAKYMDEPFGSEALLTTMSPDGKYMFFTGRREGRKGVFWVDARILESFKPDI
jgi:ankyrin repeat protein